MSREQLETLLARMAEHAPPEGADYRHLRETMEYLPQVFPIPEDVATERTAPGGVRALQLDAPDADPERLILYAHGGGYVAGSSDSHGALTAALSRAAGARVLSLDYRLAPEHPFPAAQDDLATAYAWALSRRIPSERIVFAGDSAGGGLVASTLVNLREAGAPMPRAAALLSPWIDFEATGESVQTKAADDPAVTVQQLEAYSRHYLAGFPPADPRVSPLHADLRGLPPLLIEVGTRELLLDDATRLAERAREAGGEVTLHVEEGMIHAWQVFAPMLDEGRASIERIGAWVRERLGG